MKSKLYTTKEAAEILGIDKRTVNKYLLDGTLKGAKLGERIWRISQEDLDGLYDNLKKKTAKDIKERNRGKA